MITKKYPIDCLILSTKEENKIKIEIAKHSGFCFGVSRAMEIAQKQLVETKDVPVYSVGPLIHNDQAMDDLGEKGLNIQDNIDKIEKKSFAIIRSHGLPKSIYDRMDKREINIVDATCPFVKKIQNIVFESSQNGYEIIIIGDPSHPEVIGIRGWVQNHPVIINSIEEAQVFQSSYSKQYVVVVQTTFNLEHYSKIEEILRSKINKVQFNNTICYATKQRQESAEELSKRVDAMIVIGGKKSSNTLKLAEICKKNCITFLVETSKDLDIEKIKDFENLGLVAGASTPDFIINEVYDYIVNKINI